MEFWKQKDGLSCGVIAVMNARKWMGEVFSYNKIFKPLKKELRCSSRWFEGEDIGFAGTSKVDLLPVLVKYARKNNYRVIKRCHLTATRLKYELGRGNSIVLCYMVVHKDKRFQQYRNYHYGHWCFIHGFKNRKFLVANDVVDEMTMKQMKEYCEIHHGAGTTYPVSFILQKKKR